MDKKITLKYSIQEFNEMVRNNISSNVLIQKKDKTNQVHFILENGEELDYKVSLQKLSTAIGYLLTDETPIKIFSTPEECITISVDPDKQIKRFKVNITETLLHTINVSAFDEEQAKELALNIFESEEYIYGDEERLEIEVSSVKKLGR